jgi:hypothetical protein
MTKNLYENFLLFQIKYGLHEVRLYTLKITYWLSEIPHALHEVRLYSKNFEVFFISQAHLFILYLMYYLGNMFRLDIESSSGPYIKIQILDSS